MKNDPKRLLLGSASERRHKILAEIGVPFSVAIPSVEEIIVPGDPRGTAEQNAILKQDWCLSRFPDRPLITADTVVAFDKQPIVKPASMEEARRFLRMFSGKSQMVYTGLALSCPGQGYETCVEESVVVFRHLTDEVINAYFAAVDPMDKAGAYDINVKGKLIIERYEGSYTNIMGLPREVIQDWLRRVNLWP